MIIIVWWMIAQILLEMLPVSSSGHSILLEKWYAYGYQFSLTNWCKKNRISVQSLYFIVHAPTVLVIIVYFFSSWLLLLNNAPRYLSALLWIVIVEGITLVSFTQKKYIPAIPLWIGFATTSCLLFSTALDFGNVLFDWNICHALLLGLAQSLALLPGVSRLACTVAAAHWLGYSLHDSFVISWLIHLPLMSAASAAGIYALAYKKFFTNFFTKKTILMLLAATVLSYLLLTLVMQTIDLSIFYLFGWYMIMASAVAYSVLKN
jgi:undecaprenyl pyrophosphate phosphatase UppP